MDNDGLTTKAVELRSLVPILFFAFASFVQLENFVVYAVVYGVYFLPWRMLRRPAAAQAA